MRPLRPIFPTSVLENICWQCTSRLARQSQRPFGRFFSKSKLPRASALIAPSPPQRLRSSLFFISNSLIRNQHLADPPASDVANPDEQVACQTTASNVQVYPNAYLPHRRRQAAKRSASTTGADGGTAQPFERPPDASSILAGVAAASPAHSLRRTLSVLFSLAKPRLTVLVVLTAMTSYALYPTPDFVAASDAPSLSPRTLLCLTTGTTLCSAAANTLNMLYEPRTDALMSRTCARALVRKLVSARVALVFAAGCALLGTSCLYFGVNPTVASLGAANMALYAGVYTPMKRLSAVNTWVGAVVGGIPPLMGWAAAADEAATTNEASGGAIKNGDWRELLFAADGSSVGGWLLAGLLFAWQFPHFMALSWSLGDEYKRAGLRMLAWTNPERNARVALRYGVLVFVPVCAGLCVAGVTEWSFAVTSLPVNAWMAREAVRFWQEGGTKGSAKGLFWASLWHLPAVMVLAMVQKKGMWQRVWSAIGNPEGDLDEEWQEMP